MPSYTAYIITLEAVKERSVDARELASSLTFLNIVDEIQLTPAIYWRDKEAITNFLTKYPEHTFSEQYLSKCLTGQLAATLSHIKAWCALVESNHEGAIIFEDDMYITDPSRFSAYISLIKQHPEYEWVRLHLHKKFRNDILAVGQELHIMDDPQLWGFAGYYISRTGAQKLLAHCQHIDRPIDRVPPYLKEQGLLDTKTVTEIITDHHELEGPKFISKWKVRHRHKIEKHPVKLQKSASTIWKSPPVTADKQLHSFVSDLRQVSELKENGITILKGVFDTPAVAKARKLVLDNRSLFKNTRPTPSAGHLASFHRFPSLEPLHTQLTGNSRIMGFLKNVLNNKQFRSIGLSDITINRSQHWHNDLLRGPYKNFIDENLIWTTSSGGVYKILFYLQDGASLKYIKGSHIKPISLEKDSHSEPDDNTKIDSVPVCAGDVVIMDVRCVHRGADEATYASGQWDDNPRILVSTVVGGDSYHLTDAMEKGNFYRLQDWIERHKKAATQLAYV